MEKLTIETIIMIVDNELLGSLSIKYLFKYTPKKDDSNSTICPSALIGKVPLKPERTKLKIGIYLTSYKGTDSRYLEDVLSIGYSPWSRSSVDLTDLNSNFILYNNKDNSLGSYSTVNDITRVWPAFGQIGGATEFLAVPKAYQGCLELESGFEFSDSGFDDCFKQLKKKCVKGTPEFTMHNAPRFQIFKADTASPQPSLNLKIPFFLLRQIIETSELFGDDEIIGSDPEKGKWAVFKISSSGLVIKSGTSNVTLSAGIRDMNNFCYVYLIGSKWSDKVGRGTLINRQLRTTKPIIFHSPCFLSNGQHPNIFRKTLQGAINDIKFHLSKDQFAGDRSIRLPAF